MANLNKVFLMGNVTRDPELRYTPNGMAVMDIGLAVNRKYRPTDGSDLREETTFVDITFWAKQAETLGKYIRKGSPLFVEGRLKLDSWTNKEGQKRTKLKLVGENFQFLGSGSGQQGQQAQQPKEQSQAPFDEDDDIPF